MQSADNDAPVCTGPGRCTAGYWCPVHGPTSRRYEDRNRCPIPPGEGQS